MTHILLLSSEDVAAPWSPLGGIFQLDLARALTGTGARAGIVSVGKYPFRTTFRPPPVPVETTMDGVIVMRQYSRVPVPAAMDPALWLAALYAASAGALVERYVARHGRPNVLHAHNVRYAGAVARRIARRFGIPFVVTEHSTEYERGMVRRRHVRAYRRVVNAAASVSAVSSSLARMVERILGLPAGRIVVLPNTLPSGFGGAVSNRPDGARPFRYTTVAELVPRKGHSLLIEAFRRACKGTDAELVIVGGGPEAGRLAAQVEASGLGESVRLLGRQPRDEVQRLLSETDAFVLASRSETFGVVIIEALSLGIPVVSTASGGPDELITSANGFLVPVDDVSALSDALLRVRKERSRFDRKDIAARTRDAYSPTRVAERYRAWYDQALTGTQGPAR